VLSQDFRMMLNEEWPKSGEKRAGARVQPSVIRP
jgi:hypothetical protein